VFQGGKYKNPKASQISRNFQKLEDISNPPRGGKIMDGDFGLFKTGKKYPTPLALDSLLFGNNFWPGSYQT